LHEVNIWTCRYGANVRIVVGIFRWPERPGFRAPIAGATEDDAMTDRRVRLDDLGAWLLKGNADRADLAARFADRPRIDDWCVQPSYRTELMRESQPVLFWASGSRHRLPYGVWGIGRLTGSPRRDAGSGRLHVPLDLTIWAPERRLARHRLRSDPRLADLEVLRQPQAANPSYLTVAQFAALRDHVVDGD
jgi:hypothetical protein